MDVEELSFMFSLINNKYFSLFPTDPDCLVGGVKGGVGNYPLTPNNQCSNSYYSCNANLQRQLLSCPVSLTGNYFGLVSNNVYQCIAQQAPASCSSKWLCFFEVN